MVVAHCDNQAVVEVVNSGYCKDPELMQLLRSLFFIKAHLELTLKAVHILGRQNGAADAISRNNVHNRFPTQIPTDLIDLLVVQKPD